MVNRYYYGNVKEFLEESTNTVRAKRGLGKIVLLSTYFIVWCVALIIFWQTKGHITSGFDIAFRWFLLPFYLLVSTVTVAKNDYWGKGNWLCVVGAAITFLTVPYTEFVAEMGTDIATFTFRFPNFMYMVVGIIVSICGIGIGTLWRNKTLSV